MGVAGEPDLVIRVGHVPMPSDDSVGAQQRLHIAPDGTCRFAFDTVGVYLIDADGRGVTIDPAPGADPRMVRAVLLGTVFGILCHKRNLLPLHASCVEIDGVAVAFTGPSGIGKSTLAGAFVAAGHRVLTDDVTVVDLDAPDGPLVRPTFPRLKLREDSLIQSRLHRSGAGDGPFEMQKYHMSVGEAFTQQPLRLAGLYHLTRTSAPNHLLRGIDIIRACTNAVFRPTFGRDLRGARALFSSVARLGASVPSYAIPWPTGFDDLPAYVKRLSALHTPTCIIA